MTVARDRLEKDGSDGSGLQAPATWGQKGLRKAVKGRRNALQAKDNQPNITPVYPSLSALLGKCTSLYKSSTLRDAVIHDVNIFG